MSASDCITDLIQTFQAQRPVRAGSLIITLYGDAIVPRGGTVWLGSLTQLLKPLGINERLVRTSVFRLTKENWLCNEKIGRRSYYSLSDSSRRRFEQAFKRVYHSPQLHWDGRWSLVILSQMAAELRQQVKEELEWLGFGSFGSQVLAHPRLSHAEIAKVLQEFDAQEDAILMTSVADDAATSYPLRQHVKESWNLDQLTESYSRFLDRFRPLWNELNAQYDLNDKDSFIARTLLIHEYRKVQLRDPQLPDALLPSAWAGYHARLLCRNIYRMVHTAAERWLDLHLETAEGPLPAPGPSFYQRFGGLE